jgi:phenol 2-monooxygenase
MSPQEVSYTDLLIIGAGPAGMMAAAWASQYNIKTRIIDKNHARISKGQADGLQARTLEILDSFGVAEGVWRRGYHDIEICTWVSDVGRRENQELRFSSAWP